MQGDVWSAMQYNAIHHDEQSMTHCSVHILNCWSNGAVCLYLLNIFDYSIGPIMRNTTGLGHDTVLAITGGTAKQAWAVKLCDGM